MINIGFTGPQEGMWEPQIKSLLEYMLGFRWIEAYRFRFHHGDCIGADYESHGLAQAANALIEIHPPNKSNKRAYCKGHVLHDELPYLMRNHAIVARSIELLAAPRYSEEELRSGTWSTIRHAHKQGTNILIFKPNGDRWRVPKDYKFAY